MRWRRPGAPRRWSRAPGRLARIACCNAAPRARGGAPRFRLGAIVSRYSYVRDGAEIYRRSFAIIRAEADLARFTPEQEPVAVRIIHACGQVEAAKDLVFSETFVAAAKGALAAGAPIFCRSEEHTSELQSR